MRSPLLAIAALAALTAGGPLQAACGDGLPPAGRALIEQGGLALAFAPRPSTIEVGRHFALDVVLCAATDVALPVLLAVDAEMPAHRHGMNYRATIRRLANDRYAVDGLMLHMRGRWRFAFTLRDGAEARRLLHEIDIE